MRPVTVFDPMMQHERTSLAWERTAISMMVAGLLLGRYAATLHPALGSIGILQVALGSALLIWSGRHYDDLHGPLRAGVSPVHVGGARLIGASTTAFIGIATIIALVIALK